MSSGICGINWFNKQEGGLVMCGVFFHGRRYQWLAARRLDKNDAFRFVEFGDLADSCVCVVSVVYANGCGFCLLAA